jgi:carbon starvation protein CstA
MAFGISGGLIVKGYSFFNWSTAEGASVFANVHPQGLPMWPLMFITIACGALSGFHATQSPLMARCLTNEKNGRRIFYGSMVAEGAIALVWATAGMTFYQSPEALDLALSQGGGPAGVVKEISLTLLGSVGGVLAILGVVILPISSGDTAFRAARLLIADFTGIPQSKPVKRLIIAVPLFAIGVLLSQVEFSVIWRYFGWSNQTLATIMLWAAAAYTVRRGSFHWLVTLPAAFMTATVIAYICVAKEGFGLDYTLSAAIGITTAVLSLIWFLCSCQSFRKNVLLELPVPNA